MSGRRHVLVVEDDEALGKVFELVLVDRDCDVEISRTRAGALDALRRERFDTVVADLHLRDGSGLEVLETAAAGGEGVRCVLTTGAVAPVVDVAVNTHAVAQVLRKPFRISDLLEALDLSG